MRYFHNRPATDPRSRRYGSVRPPGRETHRVWEWGSEPPILPSPPSEDLDIDLRDAADRVEITADLPDRSPDDVRVFAAGRTLRIRAAPASESEDGIDRTVTLNEVVTPDDVAVSYDDPTLSVVVRKSR